MFELYASVKDPVKDTPPVKTKVTRKSRNPFAGLSAEDAATIAASDEIICRSLAERKPSALLELKEFVPYVRIKPALMHGYLAETLFRKQLNDEGIVYENLLLTEKKRRREAASKQAYVDLVRDGVFPPSVLNELEGELPPASPTTSRGRPPHNMETLFLLVLLGNRFRLSDEALYQWACESAVVRQFAGIGNVKRIPSPKTIWFYREAWSQHYSLKDAFNKHREFTLENLPTTLGKAYKKYIVVDGTFVEAEKRHVSSAVHQQIINGDDPVKIFPNPAERRQRDVDARHTRKNNLPYFGHKAHAKIDMQSKLIDEVTTTPANVHDSQALPLLITGDDRGCAVLADSAYNGVKQRAYVESVGARPMFMMKPSAIQPYLDSPLELFRKMGQLFEEQNHMISTFRVRGEHVFGQIENAFGGNFIRCVSLVRAQAHQWLTALCYNAGRLRFLLDQDRKT